MKKSIAVNTVFNIAYNLLSILFPLVTSSYLSHLLGPTYLGKVGYAQNIASYFLVAASLGIPTYGTREIAKISKDRALTNKVFSELFLLNLLSTIVCSAGYTTVIICASGFNSNIHLFLYVGLTLYMNVFNIDWFYKGNEKYVYITVRSFIIKILSLISIFLFVRKQEDYLKYALIVSLAQTGNYVWNVINLKGRVKLQFSSIGFKQHMKPILILFATMIASDLYNQVDVTMIGSIRTEAEVGYYSNGIKLIRIATSIATAISATILPRLCTYFSEKKIIDFENLFRKTMYYVVLFAAPASLGMLLVSNDLVVVLFGNAFEPTAEVIKILCLLLFIVSISYLMGSVVLTATNQEKRLLYATISGCLTNITLNALFIPKYGINGAAVASICGEMAVLFVHYYYCKKVISGHLDKKELLTVIVSVFCMCMAVIGIKFMIASRVLRLIICIFSGVVTYVVVLWITGNKSIREVFFKVKKRIKKRVSNYKSITP